MLRQPSRFAVSFLVAALAGWAWVSLGPTADPRPDHPIPPPLKQAPPTAVECRWADTPITLDGNDDDPAWKHAQSIDGFHLPWLGARARMSRTATTAKLLWDREHLYFFARMEDSDLFADVTDHDGDTRTNDVFALFVRPDRTKPGYYEFRVNAAGTAFDAFFPKRDLDAVETQKKAARFHLDAKVKLRGTLNRREDADTGWSVEGRIPWTDFLRTGGRPEPGEAWAFNLGRCDYHTDWNEPEWSCVAPIKAKKPPAGFHQTEDYATLTFVGVDATTAAGPFGIEKQIPLTTSAVVGFPDPPPPFVVRRVFPNYRPKCPVVVRHVPGTDQFLVLTQPMDYGPTTLFRFKDDPAVTDKDAVKVMDTPGGGTAYDITFHPKFAENGYVYIGWNGSRPGEKKKYTRIARYTMKPTPPYDFDVTSEQTVIEWESENHNGAAVCFGNDGMLYVTSGDGTWGSDTNLVGQRPDTLHSKVLRIDVDHPEGGKPYRVPKDNPFVNDKRFVPETYAYGLRNPWRICGDPKTGHIWVGQNGEDLWEQVYLVRPGQNYGWSVTEGSHPFYPDRKAGPTPIVKPTVEHSHAEARSLTGGIVYHGGQLPDLKGAYLYGDYSTGRIWAVKHDGTKVVWHKEVAVTPMRITAFTTDAKGELLICDHAAGGEGGFYTLVPNPKTAADPFPRKLSETGLFDAVKGHAMKPGVIPYSVNAPFWSDGAHKERFLALPPGGTIRFNRDRGWEFPDRTVLVKSYALDPEAGEPAGRKWIETRLLTRQGGEWFGYSYAWNEEGTDATLVDGKGADKEYTVATPGGARKQVWHYPSRAECLVCHSRAQNFVLGLSEAQMNTDHTYPNGRAENQLRALERLGLLRVDWHAEVGGMVTDPTNKPQPGQRGVKPASLLHQPPARLKRLVNPYDRKQDLELRARSWLHTNCASCHVGGGGGNARMELTFGIASDKMQLLNEKPMHKTFDLPDARLIAPGAPERSVLIHRLGIRGSGQMPPLSTNRVDEAGLELMREWCRSLKK